MCSFKYVTSERHLCCLRYPMTLSWQFMNEFLFVQALLSCYITLCVFRSRGWLPGVDSPQHAACPANHQGQRRALQLPVHPDSAGLQLPQWRNLPVQQHRRKPPAGEVPGEVMNVVDARITYCMWHLGVSVLRQCLMILNALIYSFRFNQITLMNNLVVFLSEVTFCLDGIQVDSVNTGVL